MSRGGQTPGGADAATFVGVPVPGDIIASKYEVERILGAGGMGVVLAARHLQLGQLVAIKFMRLEASRDDNSVNRFLREARAAAALSSEHVTRVLDVGTLESGAPYMVMEYLAGADLAETLKNQGALDIPDAVGALLQACEAIAEAHELGIIHRDLKPSNLFVTKRRDGTSLVKVLDFGISKKIELNTQGALQSLTVSGLVIGSPLYMSPEQLRSAKAADARSDIWSLGVILYELLTAEAPFAGDTLGEVLSRIIAEPPPLIRSRRPDIPEELESIILQCLQRDVERRVQTVGELAAKLAPFASSEAALSGVRGSAPPRNAVAAIANSRRAGTSTPARSSARRVAPVPDAAQTEPAWLKSGETQREIKPAGRATRWASVLAVAVALSGAAISLYQFRGRAAGGSPGTTSTPAMAAGVATAAALPAVSPLVPAASAVAAPVVPAAVPVLPVVELPAVAPSSVPLPDIGRRETASAPTPVDAAAPPPIRRRAPARSAAATRPPTEDDLLQERQ